jgi:hypothetical protein
MDLGATPPELHRSLVLSVGLVGSSRIWPAQVGYPSIASGPDGSRRLGWMIKRMIKQGRPLDHLTAADFDLAVDLHPPRW